MAPTASPDPQISTSLNNECKRARVSIRFMINRNTSTILRKVSESVSVVSWSEAATGMKTIASSTIEMTKLAASGQIVSGLPWFNIEAM